MYRNPASAVDIAIVHEGKIILIRRGRDPFKGKWALPGGFVEYGETVEETALREVMEETGMEIELVDILGTYSAPDRDPRSHTVTTTFIANPVKGDPSGGDDADEAKWYEIDAIISNDLAFDHGQMLKDLRTWLRTKSGTYWSGKPRLSE